MNTLMNSKTSAIVSATAIVLSVGACVASDIRHHRRMNRLTLIRNDTIRPTGTNYLELHRSFMQDPRVKDSMRLIDMTDPNQPN